MDLFSVVSSFIEYITILWLSAILLCVKKAKDIKIVLFYQFLIAVIVFQNTINESFKTYCYLSWLVLSILDVGVKNWRISCWMFVAKWTRFLREIYCNILKQYGTSLQTLDQDFPNKPLPSLT